MAESASNRAEAAASRLPPLLVAAERVAATVAQGVHGRRRTGRGDSFWQFRRFAPGDAPARIDWRRSARSGGPAPAGWFVRETEWEAAQTICLWADASPSMSWQSKAATVTKRDRAELLTLALAALLLRGGERVALLADPLRPAAGRAALHRLAAELERADADRDPERDPECPNGVDLPRHCKIILISDFLTDIAKLQVMISSFARLPASGYLLQVLDPAETQLPYQGRICFTGLEREGEHLVARVEGVRRAYRERLLALQETLRSQCRTAGFGFGIHVTDRPAETALLAMYTALAA